MKTIFSTYKAFFITYSIIISICFLLLYIFSKATIFLYINHHHCISTDFIFSNLTYIGDGNCFAAILFFAYFLTRKKHFFVGLWFFASTSLVSTIFKRLIFFNELRPSAWFNKLTPIHYIDGVTIYSHNSFPSGHTITAFALAFYLTYLSENKYYGILYVLLAFLVGYSRIYLAEHFFADVTFGSLISVITCTITLYLIKLYGKKQNGEMMLMNTATTV